MKAPRFGPLQVLFGLIAILGVVLGHNWWQPGRSPWLLALTIGGCLIARQIAYGQRWLFYWIPLLAGFIAFGEGLIEGASQGSIKLPLESEAFDWAATAIAFVLMGVIAYWRQNTALSNQNRRHFIGANAYRRGSAPGVALAP
jgi:drug/metabolite transporter (DMT)-like permease